MFYFHRYLPTAGLFFASALAAFAAEPLNIVATLSTFGDLAKTVGGSHVNVAIIASPKFNPHFIDPKPSDPLKVQKADLFIHAGLDLETWQGPLVDKAGNPDMRTGGSKQLDLSAGVNLLEIPNRAVTRAEGDIHLFGNPHYWIDPENARIVAKSIASKLSEIDPANAVDYTKNFADFSAQLDKKIPEWKAKIAPFAGKEVIGYHNEWPYLMKFLGLKMDKFLEPKPGVPPGPKQADFLSQYMKTNNIKVIVQASYFPTKAAKSLAESAGGKAVLLCQGVGENSDAADFIHMMDYNVNTLVQALSGN
jgi:zinc/manganese transport system substrate-binding protein